MKPSKSKYTPKYKCDKKLKIYEPNSTSMKGFYNTNLKQAKKLYVNNKWKAPGKYKTQKPQANLNNMLNTYMKDVETMKKKDSFKNQKEEDMINQEDLIYKKQEVQKLFESFEPFFEYDDFTDPSIVLDSIPDDQNDEDQKLKNSKTENDYMMRLNGEYENENENEENKNENEENKNENEENKNENEENKNNEEKVDNFKEKVIVDNIDQNDNQEENNNLRGRKKDEIKYKEKEEIDIKPGEVPINDQQTNVQVVEDEEDYEKEFNESGALDKKSQSKSKVEGNMNDEEIYEEIEEKVLGNTDINKIDNLNPKNENEDKEEDYYSKFKEDEEKIKRIQNKYRRFKKKKNAPELKNEIFSGWDENDKNLMFIYADDVKDNEVQSLDVKVYSREKMNITTKKYFVNEMYEKHIIKNNELTLEEAKNDAKNISDNIFDVMNGKDPLDRKKQLAEDKSNELEYKEDEDKSSKNDLPDVVEENYQHINDQSLNNQEKDKNAFPQSIPNQIPYDGNIQKSIVANNNIEGSFPNNQNSFPMQNNNNEFPLQNNNNNEFPLQNNNNNDFPLQNNNNNEFPLQNNNNNDIPIESNKNNEFPNYENKYVDDYPIESSKIKEFPKNDNNNDDDFPIENNNENYFPIENNNNDAPPSSNKNIQSSNLYGNENNNNYNQFGNSNNYVKSSSINKSKNDKQSETSENFEQMDVANLEDDIN